MQCNIDRHLGVIISKSTDNFVGYIDNTHTKVYFLEWKQLYNRPLFPCCFPFVSMLCFKRLFDLRHSLSVTSATTVDVRIVRLLHRIAHQKSPTKTSHQKPP